MSLITQLPLPYASGLQVTLHGSDETLLPVMCSHSIAFSMQGTILSSSPLLEIWQGLLASLKALMPDPKCTVLPVVLDSPESVLEKLNLRPHADIPGESTT